jgi:glycosyltransferase involved in cell wall biosynthesis
MQYGVPFVTTPTGAQGLEDAKEFLQVFEDPTEFANAVLALLVDDQLWRRTSEMERAFVRENYSQDALWRKISSDFI